MMKRTFINLDENYQYKCDYCLHLNSPNMYALEQVQLGNVIMHGCKNCSRHTQIRFKKNTL